MEAWHCCLLHTWLWLSLTHLDRGLTLLLVAHMVVVVPDSPWWRPDTAVCYTCGCGCPWLKLMEAWHCCLLHMWLLLSLTHLDGGLTLLFVTHVVVVVPNSPWWRPDTAVCYTRGCGCPWLTLMEARHCCLLHTWLWLSLTHLDRGLTLLLVAHMVVVVPNSPWWRPDTAVCYTRGCPWLTLMGPGTTVCCTWLWLSLTHLEEAWHCCLLHRLLWLSLTHLDGGLTLLFVTHVVVVVPNSPWWRPDTAVCYTHGCGCPWLTLIEA